MKHFLIATDLSPESTFAIEFASELISLGVATDRYRVTFLTVFDDASIEILKHEFGGELASFEEFKPKVESRLMVMARSLPDGTEVYTKFMRDGAHAHKEISQYARELEVDGIFIATHGRTGFRHLLLGSVVEALIRELVCPIYVVPARENCSHTVLQTVPGRLILTLTDFSHEASAVFPLAREIHDLYRGHETQLMLFHVVEDLLRVSFHRALGSDPEQIWMERCHEANSGLESIRDSQFSDCLALTTVMRQQRSIGEDIVSFAESRGVALIIMGTHGWRGIKRALMGSVAEEVARLTRCPVLIVPAAEKPA